jgi:hypothetical protein
MGYHVAIIKPVRGVGQFGDIFSAIGTAIEDFAETGLGSLVVPLAEGAAKIGISAGMSSLFAPTPTTPQQTVQPGPTYVLVTPPIHTDTGNLTLPAAINVNQEAAANPPAVMQVSPNGSTSVPVLTTDTPTTADIGVNADYWTNWMSALGSSVSSTSPTSSTSSTSPTNPISSTRLNPIVIIGAIIGIYLLIRKHK